MAAASIITSVVTGGSNSHQTVAEEFNAYATDFVNQGVQGSITTGVGSTAGTGSFAVSQDSSPDMGLSIASGVAYVAGTPSGQDAQVVRARMSANYTGYTVNANSSGSTKYDWIYLSFSATNANTPSSAADNVVTLFTSRSSSNSADNGTPPTYGILLAIVTVANGASSITNSNITDKRTAVTLSTGANVSNTGWSTLNSAVTYSANNGSKEFVVNSTSDLTGVLSPGMRFSAQRSVAAPTQCMSFTAASSQYATKASPSGITFTSAFTIETWLYLNSYTGAIQYLGGRYDNSANGFAFRLTAAGQLEVFYGSAGNFTIWQTYANVPLQRNVHVAAVVSSVSGKTLQGIYLNGTALPFRQTGSATTAMTQAGNLTIGSVNAGAASTYLDGLLSEFRIWSVAQSQSAIQSNMAISLIGSESGLVALFQGNGNFNDKTSNANNLTANGGAIATQASNPYNNTEYAIITKVGPYSGGVTPITLFTGTDCTIPNMTLNNIQYSSARTPQGFPGSRNKWIVDTWYREDYTFTVGAANTYYYSFGGLILNIPIGDWDLVANGSISFGGTTSNSMLGRQAITTEPLVQGGSITNVSLLLTNTVKRYGGAGSTGLDVGYDITTKVSNTADTTYTMVINSELAAGTYTQRHIGLSMVEISKMTATSAYL